MKSSALNFLKTVNELVYQSICQIRLTAKDHKALIRFLFHPTQNSLKNDRPFTSTNTWDTYQKKIMNEVGFPVPISFLQKDSIRKSMFVSGGLDWQKTQLEYLERKFPPKILAKLLQENIIGLPRITSDKYLTSHNSIHHLYHWAFFLEKAKLKPDSIQFIVEWGGGYGNMAKIFRRLNPHSTYVILDLPIMTHLQSVYLQSIFGKSEVLVNPKVIGRGKINLFSSPATKSLIKQLTGSNNSEKKKVFVSMWALSESDIKSVSFVKKTNYFESEYIFLGYQQASSDHPNSEKIMPNKGFNTLVRQEIPFLKINYYLVGKKNA